MAIARDFIKSIDSSDNIADEIKEALTLLIDMAQSKSDLFEQEIETDLKTGKTLDNLTVPITKVLLKDMQCRAITAEDPNPDIQGIVKEDMAGMFSGDVSILNGISDIIVKAINIVVGTGEGTEMTRDFYLVAIEYPAIIRYDFKFWGRAVQAKNIREKIHNAVTSVVYKSAVDVKQLDFNTFLSVYAPILNDAYSKDISKIKEALEQAKEVFNIYKSEDNKIHFEAENMAKQIVSMPRQKNIL